MHRQRKQPNLWHIFQGCVPCRSTAAHGFPQGIQQAYHSFEALDSLRQSKQHHADPEIATAAVLETALNKLPELPQAAAPATPDNGTYRIGQRIPIGRQLGATIKQNGFFSLPVDPYTGFCADGGLPLGMGIDAPSASTVCTCHLRRFVYTAISCSGQKSSGKHPLSG